MNLEEHARRFHIEVTGLPGIGIVGDSEFTVDAGRIRPLLLTVAMPNDPHTHGIKPIQFRISSPHDSAHPVLEKSSFVLP